MWRSVFIRLTRNPERRLRAALAIGALVDLRTGNSRADNPANGQDWGPERTIRAEVLAELLTTPPDPARSTRRRPLRLAGARITGPLNLEAAEIAYPVTLTACRFEEPVILKEATAPALRLPGCHLPGLHANQLTTRGNLELNDGFTATGEIRLPGAHIGGSFYLSGATLTNPKGRALTADRLIVDHDTFCRGGFTATGEVRLIGAHLGGQLDLSRASLTNPDGLALAGDGLTVDQDMFCGNGFVATGQVRLIGAHLGGQLDLSRASLTNPKGWALTGDGLTVVHDLFCRGGFTATGEVRLAGAHVGGQLDLSRASLTNPNGVALTADRLTVDRDMFCGNGFVATGQVRLVGAHLGGQLSFNGATLTNPDGVALAGDGLTVNDSMFCGNGFVATGEVRLVGAHIGRQLGLYGATLTNPDGLALDLEAAQVGLLLLLPASTPEGMVDLNHAHTSGLDDDPATWPSKLRLRGFTYDTLPEVRPVSVRQRLDWLARDPEGYSPQPYEQLAAVYRRAGREENARLVAIAKQRRRRGSGELGWPARGWSLLLGALVGHGYRPWYAGLWLVAWTLAGGLVFATVHPQDVAPAKPSENPPAFQPVVYALDVLLPVVNLGQEAGWVVEGWARWWAWASILVGWALTTAVVAALTGLIKRV